ncbi:hypothetical protein Dimus_021205 [Dionaea muscipula]
MHLWPTMKIRDSFKISYLKNVERNMDGMKSQKQHSDAVRKLLLEHPDSDKATADTQNPPGLCLTSNAISKMSSGITACFWDLLMVLSCCCCCVGFSFTIIKYLAVNPNFGEVR